MRHDIGPSQYLKRRFAIRGYSEHRSLRDGEFSPTGHDLNVERTFAISVERLDKLNATDHPALDLLMRIACFASGELIERELLRASVGDDVDGTTVGDGLNRLLGLGLVEENEAGAIRMHRLVASFVLDTLPDEAALASVEQAVQYRGR